MRKTEREKSITEKYKILVGCFERSEHCKKTVSKYSARILKYLCIQRWKVLYVLFYRKNCMPGTYWSTLHAGELPHDGDILYAEYIMHFQRRLIVKNILYVENIPHGENILHSGNKMHAGNILILDNILEYSAFFKNTAWWKPNFFQKHSVCPDHTTCRKHTACQSLNAACWERVKIILHAGNILHACRNKLLSEEILHDRNIYYMPWTT